MEWRVTVRIALVGFLIGILLAACGNGDESRPSDELQPETPILSSDHQLEIQNFRCSSVAMEAFAVIEGKVKNISNERLDNIIPVGSWRTNDGSYVTSDEGLLISDSLLPGQTSPFNVVTAYNSAMQSCELRFKNLSGAEIPARDR